MRCTEEKSRRYQRLTKRQEQPCPWHLGSGYEAVYGQLKELAVKEGDMVNAGALLGYVSEPTKYYTVGGKQSVFPAV